MAAEGRGRKSPGPMSIEMVPIDIRSSRYDWVRSEVYLGSRGVGRLDGTIADGGIPSASVLIVLEIGPEVLQVGEEIPTSNT